MTNKLRNLIFFPTIGIIVLVVVFITAFALLSLTFFGNEFAEDNSRTASRGIRAYMEEFSHRSAAATYFLANDSEFIQIARRGDHAELHEFLAAPKDMLDIDFFIVMDCQGRVLINTYNLELHGEMARFPAWEAAQEGRSSSTFFTSPLTPLAFSFTSPMYYEGSFIGSVSGSLHISSPEFLENMSQIHNAELSFFFGDLVVASTFPGFDGYMETAADDIIVETVLQNGEELIRNETVGGINYTIKYFPLRNSDGDVLGILSAAFSREALDYIGSQLLRGFIIIGIMGASGAVIVIFMIHSLVSKPILEANERVQLMFDASPLGMFLYDENKNVIDCNTKAQEMFGYSSKKAALIQDNKTMPPTQSDGKDSIEALDALINKAFKTGTSSSEFMLQKIDGTPLPVEITHLRTKHNGADVIAEYVLDLRKLKETEEKLRELRRFERQLYNANSIPSSIWNSKYEIIQVNNAMVQFLGASSKQEALDRFMEFSPEIQPCGTSSSELIAIAHKAILKDGHFKTRWEHIIPSTGERIPCEIIMSRVDIKNDYFLVAYLHDLRDIIAAEEKEREAYDLNKIIIDSAPLIISIRNADNMIMRVSQQVLDVFNVDDKDEYIENWHMFSPEVQPCGTPSKEKTETLLAEAFRLGHVRFEWMYQTRSGEPLPMDVTLVKFTLLGEDMLVAYAFDLRPVKHAMQLALEKEQQANLAMQETLAKSRFLAQISHEIRTPMNAVLGIAEIQLQNKDLSNELKESLSHIRTSSYLLLAIINNLLDMSKAESGKMEILNKTYETVNMIVDIAQLNMFHIGSKRIGFSIRADKNLPAKLFGDELRIKQILNNLLSNAFKYTNEGSVELSFDVHRDESDPSDKITMLIIVNDTGRGMTKEQVRQLFSEEYLRFNEYDSIEGSGLGMMITYQLVKMMGGRIEVESERGKGTLAKVYLPQKTIGDAVIGSELSQKIQNFEFSHMAKYQVANFIRESMPYGRVLVVDDVELNLYVTKGHLAPYGIEVDTALSGFDAISRINTGKSYDIVFMDHMMPDMDGIETVKNLRDDGYEGVIVALTANALVGNADIFYQNGFDGFISKPLDIRELDRTLNKFISERYPEKAAKYKNVAQLEEAADSAKRDELKLAPKMIEMFQRDAENATHTLRKTAANGDVKLLTTTVHAMKSALLYIGENELSENAAKLEHAGKNGDMEYIDSYIYQFIEALEALLYMFQSSQPIDNDASEQKEDMEHLAQMLKEVEAACLDYDIKTAVAGVDALLEVSWKKNIADALKDIRNALFIDSDFDLALKILKSI